MSLSRDNLAAMKETELYPYLKVLFERMGKQNVRITHGTIEAGRDLVFDEFDDQGECLHTAVVVKKGVIRGDASGKGSAGEVFFQIQNCFGGPTVKELDLADQEVHKVLVITSGRFNEHALASLQRACANRLTEKVNFWGGDKLWSLLQKHVGAATLISSIKESLIQAGLFSDECELSLDPSRPMYGYVETDGIRVFIAPKSEKSGPLPLKLKATMKIDGLSKAIRDGGIFHFAEGEARIEYPEPLASLAGQGSLREMRITPNPGSLQVHELDLQFRAGELEVTLTDQFAFSGGGPGLIKFNNNDGRLLQKVQILISVSSADTEPSGGRTQDISIENLEICGLPIKTALTSVKLILILGSPAGQLLIRKNKDQSPILELTTVAMVDANGYEQILEVLELLQELETKLQIAFKVPDEGMSSIEITAANFVYQALTRGRVLIERETEFSISLDPKVYDGSAIPTAFTAPYTDHHTVVLLGTPIDLGPSLIELKEANFQPSPLHSTPESLVLVSRVRAGSGSYIFVTQGGLVERLKET